MFLATTAKQVFWKKDQHIVFLGEWCKLYSQRLSWQKLSSEVMKHPWKNRSQMHMAIKYESEFYEEVLEYLADFLNKVHGENEGIRFWRLIIGPWLLYYIETLHERYVCLEQALDLYPGIETLGLKESAYEIPLDMNDFNVMCSNDVYNLQLYTILLDFMGYKVEKKSSNCEKITNRRRVIKSIKKLRMIFWKFLLKWANNSETLMTDIYLPLNLVGKMIVKSNFKVRWCKFPRTESLINESIFEGIHKSRQNLSSLGIAKTDQFKEIFIQTLSYNLPLVYLEGYKAIRKWALDFCYSNKVKRIVTASGTIQNEALKFTMAEHTKSGTKLTLVQHGGNYGSTRYSTNENIEKKIADDYWTWGWGQAQNKLMGMPHPALSAMKLSQNLSIKPSQYILFVGNSNLRYRLTNVSCPMGWEIKSYVNWQIQFFRSLSTNVLDSLLFRPYHQDQGWSIQHRIQNKVNIGNIDIHSKSQVFRKPREFYHKIFSNKAIYYKLLEASLVICDMNQTTFLEALALNIPLVIFWNDCYEELRTSAKPYYDDLRRVGILHSSPEDAAMKVNQIADNPSDWWNREDIQNIRRKFCRQFVRTSDHWLYEWVNQLEK